MFKILTPQDSDLRLQFKTLLQSVQVPSIADPNVLVAPKWVIFTELPETLGVSEKGDSIDVLRSPADVVTLVDGDTYERINAWVITSLPVKQTKVATDQRGTSTFASTVKTQGKVEVERKFRLMYFKGFGGGEMRTAIECDAVRRYFNERAKLGFTSPAADFVIRHNGLQEVFSDSGEYGDTMAYLKVFEITVYLYEIYN